MIPWIAERLKNVENGHLFYANSSPAHMLCSLVWDIQQNKVGKEQLMFVEAPRSLVFHNFGDASYLFWRKSRVPFASFAVPVAGLTSVGLRYNDPLDPASGLRKKGKIMTGWQGAAELLDSAVRRSSNWKNLQTIEVEAYERYGRHEVTYELWATPVGGSRYVRWEQSYQPTYTGGSVTFYCNEPMLIARATVNRGQDGGQNFEDLLHLTIYPELRGYQTSAGSAFSSRNWGSGPGQVYLPNIPPIEYLDLSHQTVTHFTPHDELVLTVNRG